MGGIYDWIRNHDTADTPDLRLQSRNKETENQDAVKAAVKTSASNAVRETDPTEGEIMSYAERKERQKLVSKLQKQVAEVEKKIAALDDRLSELDTLLSDPENASDMSLVNEYSDISEQQQKAMETWEKISMELESVKI